MNWTFYFTSEDNQTQLQIDVPSDDCDKDQASRVAKQISIAINRKYGPIDCPKTFDCQRILAPTLTCKCKRTTIEKL